MERKSFNQVIDEIFGVADSIRIDDDNSNEFLQKALLKAYRAHDKYIQKLEDDNKKWKEEYDRLAKFTGERFNRSNKKIAELQDKLDTMGESSSDLKAEFIGEYSWHEEVPSLDPDEEDYVLVKRVVPWTVQKAIFREMCEYVRNRKDEDYRP